jgi:hypothetical protein
VGLSNSKLRIDSVRRVLLFFIPTLLGAPPVRAQTNLGLATGLTMPVSELGRIDNVGFHVSAVVQSSQPLTTFGLRGDLSFNSFARKATIRDVTERIFSITAGPIFHPAGLATSYPYAVGEFGIYTVSTSPAPIGSRSATDLGVNVGAGYRFAIGARSTFAEVRYHRILTEGGARYLPLTFGLLF